MRLAVALALACRTGALKPQPTRQQLLRGAALNAVLIAEVVLRTVPGAPEPEPLPADTTVQGTSPPTRVFGMPVLTVLAAAAAAGFFAGRRVGRA